MNKKIIASVLAVASVLTVSAGALADDNITVTEIMFLLWK